MVASTLVLCGLMVALLGLASRLLRASRQWTGPKQDARIKALERERDHDRLRLSNLEQNHGIQFRELEDSINGVYREVRQVAATLALISGLPARVEGLELSAADGAQERQFFKDLGCGHPECPRWRSEPPPAQETKE